MKRLVQTKQAEEYENDFRTEVDGMVSPSVARVTETDQSVATLNEEGSYEVIDSSDAYDQNGDLVNLLLIAGDYSDLVDEIRDPTVFDHEADLPREAEFVKEIKRERYAEAIVQGLKMKYGADAGYRELGADHFDEHENVDLDDVKEHLENQEFRQAEKLIAGV